ncbi:MAG: glycosyltransferase [Clostridia bacterium]|nr:glycosyltransferase [Clostridia bacterium]
MLLSVIIPFYNVEAYIGACLECLEAMPPEECEVLLVDDRGADGSAAIAQAFVSRHPNARVLKREANGGLSAARNTGMAAASGEYVCFIDSDDLPEAEAIIGLAREAKEKRLDVIKGRFVYLFEEKQALLPGPPVAETEVMPGGELFARQCEEKVYEPMVWQCIYRRAFLEKIGLTMPEGLLFEDELFQAPALIRAERAAASARVLLRYRQREGSIMSSSFQKRDDWYPCYLEICRRLDALAKTLPEDRARRALETRVGQIALSVVKNIWGYRISPEASARVMAFAKAHRKELAGYALRARDKLVRAQGALLWVSPKLFALCYQRMMEHC